MSGLQQLRQLRKWSDGSVSEATINRTVWATSSLRAYLLGSGGQLLDGRGSSQGIQHLPTGGFAEAFRGTAGEWTDRFPELPILAAGMVGSRTGWHEVPYVPCPTDIAAIAQGLLPFVSDCGTIHLVPGLSQGGSRPDVMRGEETQIVGALAQHPELTEESLVVLPGRAASGHSAGAGGRHHVKNAAALASRRCDRLRPRLSPLPAGRER